ncbi:MAG TPA: hypothetical protein PLG22_07220 [Kiritimatiellia bacterium]|nr:hypothetical protein [Kiritimatiellia bacterium]
MAEMSIEVRGADGLEKSIPAKINTRPVLAAGAGEYKKAWLEHFQALDARGNRRGFPPKNFWIEEGYKKTGVAELNEAYATVTCDSRAVAFRAYGGTVRPVSAKALAIPVSAAAYAAGWPGNSGLPLEFVPVRSKKNPRVIGKLVEARATRIGYGKKGVINKGENVKTAGTTHYLLFDQITQRGMGVDAVRPEAAGAEARVFAKMASAVQRQFERQAGGQGRG